MPESKAERAGIFARILPDRVSELHDELAGEIEDLAGTLKDDWSRFCAGSVVPGVQHQRVHEELASELELLRQQLTSSPQFAVQIESRVHDLFAMRAYVIPIGELLPEALSHLQELREWSVPDESISELSGRTLPAIRDAVNDEDKARFALYNLLSEYAFWDVYVDWFNRVTMRNYRRVGVVAILSLFVSGMLMMLKLVIPGFVVAGLFGASISLLVRLVTPQVFARAVALGWSVTARLAAGTTAACVAMGLLVLGIIQFGANNGYVSCLENGGECDVRGRLILFSIAILVGLSERALPTFEGLFPVKDGKAAS